MAELIASTLLEVVLSKLTDEAARQVDRVQGIHSELMSLKNTLIRIKAFLVDASDKEIKDVLVQNWLNDLKHLAYDIDDILDDLATDDMHPDFVMNSEANTSKVRKLFSSWYTKFSLFSRTHNRFDNINVRLQDLEDEKTTIGLIGGLEVRNNRSRDINRDLETSVVDASSIVGRQGDKDELIDKLLGNDSRRKNFSIVPILGMGGVGKTTLAKIVYEDKQVNDHFTCKAWVCVSEEWDSVKISNIVFQSVTGETKEFRDLNLLQIALRDQLRGKQFLLVLDDVWTDKIEDWKTLVRPFSVCARGSKVIITTRKDQLLRDLHCSQLKQLQCLSPDDAMSLFCKNALDANNFDSYPTLKAYGKDIVGKCNGLPLALIALGRLLWRKERDEVGWKEVVDSKVWSLKEGGGILAALKLSYHELPASLKKLFAYCSLFPKDYLFDKDDLVLLWMAEGFLHQSEPSESQTVERIGLDCFDDLLSRSFFQHSPNDESLYVMHDLMNDLATSVARGFFFRIEKGGKPRKPTWDKYRHISFIFEEYGDYKNFQGIKGPKGLRTFLSLGSRVNEWWLSNYLLNKVLVDILPQLKFLRVLSLSGYEISELPDSIGKLKHLRYLNLSRTKITQLPENVCDLYNLETLILFGCSCLTKFPENFSKLKSLRHLDIRDTPQLEDFPLGIGELKSLRALTKIIIKGEDEFYIFQPKGFENVQGKISSKGLDKVLNATEAQEAFLSKKRFTELEVEWCDVSDATRNDTTERDVLAALEPDKICLKRLGIVNYLGLEFPKWVGDPFFHKLARVSIRGCKKCTSLPPLGQLRSLKELSIQDMGDVKVVGSEFLGTGLVFPRLEVLSFEGMQGWEVWSTKGTSTTGDLKDAVFPRLKELHITNCPNLVNVSPETLPLLKHLEISSCGGGVLRSLVDAGPSVTKLIIMSISGLTNAAWRGVIVNLNAVEELIVQKCDEISYLWESKEVLVSSRILVNLRKLKVERCKNLVSLGEKDEEEYNNGSNLLTFLWSLEVWSCENFKHLSCPNNIEVLQIFWCGSITCVSFSTGGRQKLRSVTFHMCENILLKEELQGGGESYRSLLINSESMPVLEYVWIHDYPNLASLIEFRGNFNHLNTMSIADCKSTVESLFADLDWRSLTSLTNLEIYDCPSMDAPGLWPTHLSRLFIGRLKRRISEWGTQKFPTSLVEVIIRGEEVTNWSQLSNLRLPSSVTQLHIDNFHNLETVTAGLRHLTSLQHLTISVCPKMKDLPEMLLPKLLSLKISGCPDLKERCSERGSYWRQISHIPCIVIDT